MNFSKYMAILAILFLFQGTFAGKDTPLAVPSDSALPAVPPAAPFIAPVVPAAPVGHGSSLYSVSIVKKLFNGVPLTQEEKRFPKMMLGMTALCTAMSITNLKMNQQPVSWSSVALLTAFQSPVIWFFSEFLNGEWDD